MLYSADNNVSQSTTKVWKCKRTHQHPNLISILTRTFGTASLREPSQKKSSTSSLHGEGSDDGGSRDMGFWSGGTGGAVRLPDPPALCAITLWMRLVLSRVGCSQNPEQLTSEDGIAKDKKYQNFFVVLMDFSTKNPIQYPECKFVWLGKRPIEHAQTETMTEESLSFLSKQHPRLLWLSPAGCNANLRGRPAWQEAAAGIFSMWKHYSEVHPVNVALSSNRLTVRQEAAGQTVLTSKPEDMKNSTELSVKSFLCFPVHISVCRCLCLMFSIH